MADMTDVVAIIRRRPNMVNDAEKRVNTFCIDSIGGVREMRGQVETKVEFHGRAELHRFFFHYAQNA